MLIAVGKCTHFMTGRAICRPRNHNDEGKLGDDIVEPELYLTCTTWDAVLPELNAGGEYRVGGKEDKQPVRHKAGNVDQSVAQVLSVLFALS